MPSTRYGTSLWVGRAASSKRPASSRLGSPRLKGEIETDVVVIGGGLTGCLVACQFARAGVKTVLRRSRTGRGARRRSTPAGSSNRRASRFASCSSCRGCAAARRASEASRRAALDVAAFLRRLDIRCDLEPRQALLVATSPDQARELEREHQARVGGRASMRHGWPGAGWRPKRASSRRAPRSRRTARRHRSAAGGAAACWRRRSRPAPASSSGRAGATGARAQSKAIDVTTEGGVVHAQTAIVATGAPKPIVAALQRHVRVAHTYLVATPELPTALQAKLSPATPSLRDLAAAAAHGRRRRRRSPAGAGRRSAGGARRGCRTRRWCSGPDS